MEMVVEIMLIALRAPSQTVL